MIRTSGDVVLAVNMSRDLESLVTGFLLEWRKHANGVNGVEVPSGNFNIAFLPLKLGANDDPIVCVKLFYTYTTHHSEPTYYDFDSENFSESWGASNISGERNWTEKHDGEKGFDIPCDLFMRSKESMIEVIKGIAQKHKADEAEAARQAELASLHERIKELEKP